MGVYIKGMEMPKSCFECFALDDSSDYPCCLITQETKGYTFHRREVRMPKCPLVSVPPHGRLIDADALEYSLGIEDRDIYAYHIIGDAPTVIEAEECGR